MLSTLAWAAPDERLIDAVKRGDQAAVESLLKQGVDVNARQGDGATALHWAAHHDDRAMVERLIRAGASVQAANELGVTPLLLACTNGSARVVEALLSAGANPNAAAEGRETPLMVASWTGNADVVRRLQGYAATRSDEPAAPVNVSTLVQDAITLTRALWKDEAEARGVRIDVVADLELGLRAHDEARTRPVGSEDERVAGAR